MTSEILSIGTEILLGNILNTDTRYIAKRLQECGVSCFRQTVVGDNSKRICDVITESLKRVDILFVTGGLGPTADDITRESVAKAAGVELVEDDGCVEHIKKYFAAAKKTLTPNNMRQALVPKGARVYENHWGSANAFSIAFENKKIYVLPGPPRELQPIFEKYIANELVSDGAIVKRQVHMFGIWESAVEEKVLHLTRDCVNPSVGIYAGHGDVMLQVTARADDEKTAFSMTEPVVKEIQTLLGDFVYGIDVPNIETRVVNLLHEKKKTVAFAESCTGGLVAKRIVDVSGASDVFGFGAVTYANEAKEKMLGVKHATLENFGAVSPETAGEMAQGIREFSGADIGVAVTGVAGPTGGTAQKPVGLVWFGISTGEFTKTYKIILTRNGVDRDYIREYSSAFALNLVRKYLDGTLD